MDRRDLEQIEKFLGIVGKASLFEYFGIDAEADPHTAEDALKKKRAWAQGQQGNPKFRSESLWLIKNMPLARRALLDERGEYLKEVRGKDASRNLEILTLFIRGALADGSLTTKKEEAIRHQGAELGLEPAAVAAQIEASMVELGATRGGEDESTEDAPLIDYYAALEVARDVDQDALERAYRARYRWARNLRDVKKASEVYAQLDEAWRILKDADKRALYNARLESQQSATAQLAPDPPMRPLDESWIVSTPVGSRPEITEDTDSDIAIIPGAPPARGPRSLDGSAGPSVPPGSSRVLGFQDGMPVQPNESIPPIRQAPRPPERIGGRTLGLGKDAGRPQQKAPRLQLDGPEVHRVVAWRSPVAVKFTVRNAGSGQMSGRVFSDRDWVQVAPARLDPDAQRQTIEITVHPKSMPRSRAVSLVTVVADHGERKVVTVETQRQMVPGGVRTVLGVGAVLLLVATLLAGILYVIRPSSPPVESGPGTRLIVTVDPPVGQIFVGEGCGEPSSQKECRQVSEEGGYDGQMGFPIDKPVFVRVQYWGFKTVMTPVTVRPNEETKIAVVLELDPAQTWSPPQNAIPADVPHDDVARVFALFGPNLSACLAAAGIPEGREYAVTVEGAIKPEGQVYDVRLSKTQPRFPTGADPDPCLHRTLRALPFAKLESDAYGTFRYDFDLESPAR